MPTVNSFLQLLNQNGSPAKYKRADSLIPCPCRTPEGYRDPVWHMQAPPGTPMCDENGMLPDPDTTVEITVKAFVQPIQSTRATRLSSEYIQQMFGEVQTDDHLGIFPYEWGGKALDFHNWSLSGEDYVEYDNRRYLVVNANKIPDPSGGNPNHHWEVGLRLISDTPL